MKSSHKSHQHRNHPAQILRRAHRKVRKHSDDAAKMFEDLLTAGVITSVLRNEARLQQPHHA